MSDMTWSEELVTTPAMTLREHYAGLAMQAMVSAITALQPDDIITNRPLDVAEISKTYADAMIAELQREDTDA